MTGQRWSDVNLKLRVTQILVSTVGDLHSLARLRRLFTEGSWIVAGQIVSMLGALVLVRVLTEYLDPLQYGQLALGLTVAGLVNQVVMGGIVSGIGRFYSIATEKQDIPGYLDASRRLMTYATLAVLAIGLTLLAGLLFLGYPQWVGLVVAVLLFSVLSGYKSTLSGIQNAARQRAVVAFHGGLDAWLKVLFALGLLLWLGSSGTAVVIGYAISSLLVTGSQFLFLRRLIPRQSELSGDSAQWTQQMWVYSWPMAAAGFFNWGYFASQRWALELFATTSEVGQFYGLTQIAYTPICMAGGMLLSFLTPILYARAGDARDVDRLRNTHRVVIRVAAFGLGMTIALAVASCFGHGIVFRLMVAPEYRGISMYMPFVVIAAGVLQVSQAMGSIILIRRKTSAMLPLAIWGQLYISAQNFLFVYFWGIPGLIFSMVIGALLHLGWMSAIVFKLSITK